MLIVAMHIDNLMLAASSEKEMMGLKCKLRSQFELVYLGPVHWLLGIKVKRDEKRHTLSLSQEAFITKMVL
jgi:hypothetical protein